MTILWQLIVGLIIGALARLLLPGKEAIAGGVIGWLITALIGMGGAFLGTMLGRAIWKQENYAAGWIMSILGAILLLMALSSAYVRRLPVTTSAIYLGIGFLISPAGLGLIEINFVKLMFNKIMQ